MDEILRIRERIDEIDQKLVLLLKASRRVTPNGKGSFSEKCKLLHLD